MSGTKKKSRPTLSDRQMMRLWRNAVHTIWGSYCAVCGDVNAETHHIVPRKRATLRYDFRNGIPLCQEHHRWVETLDGKEWLRSKVDIEYLRNMDVNIKDLIFTQGVSRSEYVKEQADELKRIIERGRANGK